MKNNHALIDPKTGLVRNVIIWEGAEWTPPREHYVVHDCDGQIGDYWHQEKNCFYTKNGKHRFRDKRGKVGEREMSDEEKKELHPRLKEIYAHAAEKYRWQEKPDLSLWDNQVPQLEGPLREE